MGGAGRAWGRAQEGWQLPAQLPLPWARPGECDRARTGRDLRAAQQRAAPLRRKLGALLRGGAARGAGLSVVGLPRPGILAGRSRAAVCLPSSPTPVRRRGDGGSPGTTRVRLLIAAPPPPP